MCRAVDFVCFYCGASFFFMWEECAQFWLRYRQVVIDRDNFDQRPRISRSADLPPACPDGIQQCHSREAPLGRCPRLRECSSLRPYLKQQQKQHRRTMSGGDRRGSEPRYLAQLEFWERADRALHLEAECFGKGPVRPLEAQVETMARRVAAARLEEGSEADDEKMDDGDSEEEDEDLELSLSSMTESSGPSMNEPPASLLGDTLPAVQLSMMQRPTAGAESLSQSADGTVFETGSEVESREWSLDYEKPPRPPLARGVSRYSI